MNDFIEDVLYNAKEGLGRYRQIDSDTKKAAQKIYNELKNKPWNISGNVIGVDLSSGTIRISRWGR